MYIIHIQLYDQTSPDVVPTSSQHCCLSGHSVSISQEVS